MLIEQGNSSLPFDIAPSERSYHRRRSDHLPASLARHHLYRIGGALLDDAKCAYWKVSLEGDYLARRPEDRTWSTNVLCNVDGAIRNPLVRPGFTLLRYTTITPF